MRRVALEQLDPYETVAHRALGALSAGRVSGGFEITLEDGSRVTGRRLLLANGLRYGLPDIDGVTELWGERVFHCPYCHGWEVRDRPIGVYGCGEKSVHQALLLSALSDDIVLLWDDDAEPVGKQRERLDAAGIEVVDDWETAVALLATSPDLREGAVVEPNRPDLFDLNVSVRTAPTLAVSEIEKPSPTPGLEARIAAAGPLVSLLLGVVAFGLAQVLEPDTVGRLLAQALMASNFIVGVFNLLPGLPLDGGRVLSAAVWKATGRRQSGLLVAAWCGRGVAALVLVRPRDMRSDGPVPAAAAA